MDARVTPRVGGSSCAADPRRGGRAAHTQLTRASPWLPPRSLSRTDHKQDTQPRRTNPVGRACKGDPSGRGGTAATDGDARRHRKHLRGGTCGRRLTRGGGGERRKEGEGTTEGHAYERTREESHRERGEEWRGGKGGGADTNLRRPQERLPPRRAERNPGRGERDTVTAERLHNRGVRCMPQTPQRKPRESL